MAHQSKIVQQLCSQPRLCAVDPGITIRPSRLKVTVIPGKRLTQEQVAIWRNLQEANLQLSNPCFSPDFIQAIAAVRDDLEVAILSDRGTVVGFFPFQRKGRARAVPAGGIVSDYQGLICRPSFRCEPRQLLKGCGLIAWDFDRLLASEGSFVPYHRLCEPSALIDLSEGYEAYAWERRQGGTRQLHDCECMMRRIEREVGPLRFIAHSDEPSCLAQVLAWKSEQYRRSGWNDLFATNWAGPLLKRIQTIQNQDFGGMLSLLYAGPFLVAGHMGMRSRTVWHYWFPAYDRRFAKYSPGLILLVKMAQHAEDFGLRCIDVGTGLSLYKKRLMNAAIDVAEGSIETPSCLGLFRSGRRALRALAKNVRLAFKTRFLAPVNGRQ